MIYEFTKLYCNEEGQEVQELRGIESSWSEVPVKYLVLLTAMTPVGITTHKQEIVGAKSIEQAFQLLPKMLEEMNKKQEERAAQAKLSVPRKSGLIV